jgi:hypothetical protein
MGKFYKIIFSGIVVMTLFICFLLFIIVTKTPKIKVYLCSTKGIKQLIDASTHNFLVWPSSDANDIKGYSPVYIAEIESELKIAGKKTTIKFTSEPFILSQDVDLKNVKNISERIVIPFPKTKRNERIAPVFNFKSKKEK